MRYDETCKDFNTLLKIMQGVHNALGAGSERPFAMGGFVRAELHV